MADPVSPVLGEFLGLGPAGAAELALDEDAATYRRWVDAVERALTLAQLPYDLVDESDESNNIVRFTVEIDCTR